MGKAVIVSHAGDGLYNVKLQFDVEQIQARKTYLTQQQTELTERLASLITEVNSKKAALAEALTALNQYVEDTPPGVYISDPTELNRLTRAGFEAKTDLELSQRLKARANLDLLSVKKELASIEKYGKAELDQQAWCAEYATDLAGPVGTIEVDYERAADGSVIIQPAPSAHDPARDGLLAPPITQSVHQLYTNLAYLPAAAKWKPRYRLGTLTGKAGNRGEVLLDAEFSSQQHLAINQSDTLSDVPIQYMSCDGDAFEVGDRVLLAFAGDWSTPTIIGFAHHPRECLLEAVLAWPGDDSGAWYPNAQLSYKAAALTLKRGAGIQGGNCYWSNGLSGAGRIVLTFDGPWGYQIGPPLGKIGDFARNHDLINRHGYRVIEHPAASNRATYNRWSHAIYAGQGVYRTAPRPVLGVGMIGQTLVCICVPDLVLTPVARVGSGYDYIGLRVVYSDTVFAEAFYEAGGVWQSAGVIDVAGAGIAAPSSMSYPSDIFSFSADGTHAISLYRAGADTTVIVRVSFSPAGSGFSVSVSCEVAAGGGYSVSFSVDTDDQREFVSDGPAIDPENPCAYNGTVATETRSGGYGYTITPLIDAAAQKVIAAGYAGNSERIATTSAVGSLSGSITSDGSGFAQQIYYCTIETGWTTNWTLIQANGGGGLDGNAVRAHSYEQWAADFAVELTGYLHIPGLGALTAYHTEISRQRDASEDVTITWLGAETRVRTESLSETITETSARLVYLDMAAGVCLLHQASTSGSISQTEAGGTSVLQRTWQLADASSSPAFLDSGLSDNLNQTLTSYTPPDFGYPFVDGTNTNAYFAGAGWAAQLDAEQLFIATDPISHDILEIDPMIAAVVHPDAGLIGSAEQRLSRWDVNHAVLHGTERSIHNLLPGGDMAALNLSGEHPRLAVVKPGAGIARIGKRVFQDDVHRELALAVNGHRVAAGVSELIIMRGGPIFDAALAHSQYCAELQAANHDHIESRFAAIEAYALGYLKTEGENVAAWSEYDETLFVDGWVESPSHYANIVNPNFTHTVIAVYTDPATGWAAATQLFWGMF